MAVDQVDPLISSIYHWMDISGVLLMGIIGGTLARQLGYDIVGFFFIAMLSALGGGMLRDVLINQGTVAAMNAFNAPDEQKKPKPKPESKPSAAEPPKSSKCTEAKAPPPRPPDCASRSIRWS